MRLFLLGPLAVSALLAACGGTTPLDTGLPAVTRADAGADAAGDATASDAPGPGPDGTVPDGASARCQLDPAGATFTFHIHNRGTAPLSLDFGCGRSIPITVATAQGQQGVGPGPADVCEFTCEEVYSGTAAQGCSDCGPPQLRDLAPSATVDVAWDRRAYVEIRADTACVASGQSCALGTTVPATATQAGSVTICKTQTGTGGCASSAKVSFTLDTTKSEGTIAVP
jgi:hypothetical protein